MSYVVVELPIHTVSEPNIRQHWAPRANRAKSHRLVSALAVRAQLPSKPLPCAITLTRVSPGTLDDDNLRGALKAVRDGIADALGTKDNDPRIAWNYAQEKARRGEHYVLVRWSQG